MTMMAAPNQGLVAAGLLAIGCVTGCPAPPEILFVEDLSGSNDETTGALGPHMSSSAPLDGSETSGLDPTTTTGRGTSDDGDTTAVDGDGTDESTAETLGLDTATTDGEGSSGSTGTGPSGPPPQCEAVDQVRIGGGSFTDNGNGPNVEHQVAAFRIDVHEVTVSEYQACIEDEVCSVPIGRFTQDDQFNYGANGREQHPVNGVTFSQAQTYCGWVCSRLPTEWEWEWAARGRTRALRFPWGGDELPPSCNVAVIREDNQNGCGTNTTDVVGSRSPYGDSWDGVADMSGNVFEWTDSLADDQVSRIVRGGDFTVGLATILATNFRTDRDPFAPDHRHGFRCARTDE